MGDTAEFCGSNPERQRVGLPGHCERCARVGHVLAHPDLGCGDVGCTRYHDEEPSPKRPRIAYRRRYRATAKATPIGSLRVKSGDGRVLSEFLIAAGGTISEWKPTDFALPAGATIEVVGLPMYVTIRAMAVKP